MLVTLLVLALIVFVLVMIYNGIIALKNKRENAFADIDVQLKQRYDLIGNLVNTVKGYAKHESETFEKVTAARTSFLKSGTIDEKIQADNAMSGCLKTLFAVSESYPELKANQNFLQLQEEISDLENKLGAARRFFNAATKEYNTHIEVFPNNVIANMFGFKREVFFEIVNEEEKKAPVVNFD